MIYQDFWLTPDGTFEQSSSEHAKYAKRVMLRLDEFYPIPDPYAALTKAEAREALRAGVPKKVIAFLEKGGDPRKWMLKEHGWIRTAQNSINVWKLDPETLTLLRDWVKDLNMDSTETFDLEEYATGNQITVSARQLRNSGVTAEALRAYGQGVGRYRNPDQLEELMQQFRDEQGRDPEGEEIEILKSRIDPLADEWERTLKKPQSIDAYADRQAELAKAPGQQFFQYADDLITNWISVEEGVLLFLEDHNIDEYTPGFQDTIDVMTRTIAKNFGFGAMRRRGKGSFATAFYTPQQTILKLTFDLADVKASAVVIEKPGTALVKVYKSGLSQVDIRWREGEEGGFAGVMSRIGLIETEFVPYDFDVAFGDDYRLASESDTRLGRSVANVKDKFNVWPSDIHGMSHGAAVARLIEAQTYLIKMLKSMVYDAPLEAQEPLDNIVQGIQELLERGIYSVDFHAANARWTGDIMLLTDFGVGRLRWDVNKKRSRVFRKNPPEAENVVVIDSPIEPQEFGY